MTYVICAFRMSGVKITFQYTHTNYDWVYLLNEVRIQWRNHGGQKESVFKMRRDTEGM